MTSGEVTVTYLTPRSSHTDVLGLRDNPHA